MNYPDNFDVPAFPAGKRIAISRITSIGTAIAFLLICCVCVLLVWTARSQRVHPFIISVNNETGTWQVVGHDHGRKKISAIRNMQEHTVARFVESWFTISGNAEQNAGRWAECRRDADCLGGRDRPFGDATCAMFCISGNDIFSKFTANVAPEFQRRAAGGERWGVMRDSMRMAPVGPVGENGGTWRVQFAVVSNMSAPLEITAYAKVVRNKQYYPQTLGFYVADFNAYKTN